MKKIIIKESQLKKILKEQEDNRFRKEVKVDVYDSSNNFKYNGMEIIDMTAPNITLTFIIEQEFRSWGIKDISLYGIQGPNSIELEINYYKDEDNEDSAIIEVPLDWNNLEVNDMNSNGIITIGDELNIEILKDSNDKITTKMSIDVFKL